MLLAALFLSGALALAQQAPPSAADANPPTPTLFSVEHIRAALDIPHTDLLMRREITPDFVVNIRERERFEKLMMLIRIDKMLKSAIITHTKIDK